MFHWHKFAIKVFNEIWFNLSTKSLVNAQLSLILTRRETDVDVHTYLYDDTICAQQFRETARPVVTIDVNDGPEFHLIIKWHYLFQYCCIP